RAGATSSVLGLATSGVNVCVLGVAPTWLITGGAAVALNDVSFVEPVSPGLSPTGTFQISNRSSPVWAGKANEKAPMGDVTLCGPSPVWSELSRLTLKRMSLGWKPAGGLLLVWRNRYWLVASEAVDSREVEK